MTGELLPDSYFIRPFDAQHAVYLGIFLIVLFLILAQHRRIKEQIEPVLGTTLALSIMQVIILYGSYLAEGFNWAEGLPLHISRISTFIGIFWLITRKPIFMDILFFFGLYAYGSFFYPSRVHPITHPIGISFLVNHIVTILLPIISVIAFDWRPTKRAYWRSVGFFLIYLAAAMVTNALTGGNYFYMTKRIAFHDLPLWQYTIFVIFLTMAIFAAGFFAGNALIKAYHKRQAKHARQQGRGGLHA